MASTVSTLVHLNRLYIAVLTHGAMSHTRSDWAWRLIDWAIIRGVASFLDFPGIRLNCPHANYLARNASPSLWTLYYTFAFEKLFKSAYMYLASYYTLLFVQLK